MRSLGAARHVRVEGDEHHPNLYVVLVGDTAKARKGKSLGRVEEVFGLQNRPPMNQGLSSGEGLKWAVRDRIAKQERDKKTKQLVEVEEDPGVPDKRLLVTEPEFAQVLRQCARAGNTLSATVRCAWDRGTLATLTKHDAITATGTHIAIIGHITADELRAELTATESANGFANRFLFMSVRRSKLLPFGGSALDAQQVNDIRIRIAAAAKCARHYSSIAMTPDARQLWEKLYPRLSQGMPGLFGAVTARAEAQCIRLSLVYALMHGVGTIDESHVLAAVAVWERCEASAKYIFGSALGDHIADRILAALEVAGPEGMTRSQISALFDRNYSVHRLEAALSLLARYNLAKAERRATGKKPIEVWVLASLTVNEINEINESMAALVG